MIVELFGPPCAGKTTFARQLRAGLSDRGLETHMVISARASEGDATAGGAQAERPDRHSRAALREVNHALMRLLPPRSLVWRLRLGRYLDLLAEGWVTNGSGSGVAIFDQGYAQALCSLASLTRAPGAACLRAAVGLLPLPAIRINLTVSGEVLLERLEQRARTLTLRERLLEPDAATILKQDRICATLFDLFSRDGEVLRTASAATHDAAPLWDAVAARLQAQSHAPGTGTAGSRPRILKEVGRS